MLCENCGHDERVHNEDTERCCAPTCRCSQFEIFDTEIEKLIEAVESHDNCECSHCDDDEEKSYVEFNIKIPRVHVADFVQWLTEHSPDDLPAEPMEIPDTIRPDDLNLNDPETREWLIEKIRSKN